MFIQLDQLAYNKSFKFSTITTCSRPHVYLLKLFFLITLGVHVHCRNKKVQLFKKSFEIYSHFHLNYVAFYMIKKYQHCTYTYSQGIYPRI